MSSITISGWLALSAGAALVLLLAHLTRRRATGLSDKIRWFRRPRNRPAIYLIRSARDPRLLKVGYTGRYVEKRMAEIAQERGPVILLFSLRMPHAYAAEQAAHRALRGARGVRRAGGEWYHADPRRVRSIVLGAAYRTRRRARLRLAWPRDGRIFVWKDLP